MEGSLERVCWVGWLNFTSLIRKFLLVRMGDRGASCFLEYFGDAGPGCLF